MQRLAIGTNHIKKMLDPFLLAGVVLLILGNQWSALWLTYHAFNNPWHSLVLVLDWLMGIGGILGVLIGIIRPIVRALIDHRFLSAVIFYCVIWLLLSLPLLAASIQQSRGIDMAPAAGLYLGLVMILFWMTNGLILVSYAVTILWKRYQKDSSNTQTK